MSVDRSSRTHGPYRRIDGAGYPGVSGPGTDDCDEHAAKISEIMEGVVSDFSPKGCESVEMNSFLLSDTQMPIVASEEAWEESDSLFGLVALKKDDHIAVVVAMNLDKYGTLSARMKDKFHQTIDLGSSKISLVLNNDDRGDISFGRRTSS